MAYRDDLEAALQRAEALEADRTRQRAQPADELVCLRKQLAAARMQVAALRSERFKVERELRGAQAELGEELHARAVLEGQKAVLAVRNEELTLELKLQAEEFAREREARRWAVQAAKEAADALREVLLVDPRFRDAGAPRPTTTANRRRLLSWVSAEGLTSVELPRPYEGRGAVFHQLVERFGPNVLRSLPPEHRAGRLRELGGRIARSTWLEGERRADLGPAIRLLTEVGHVLAPRHGATLRVDIRVDGLALEWLDEDQPIHVDLSAAEGFAVRGVRDVYRTPVH
ncbi:MAG: hypothetical protein AB8I08_23120 [Sandaracinaceae bacterium]